MKTEIFKCKIFVICKVLTKFTKILSHEYLEPYSIIIKACRSHNHREAISIENTKVNSLHFTEVQTYTSIEGAKLY